MRFHVFLICLMGLLASTSDTSGQSLLNRVKGVANKASQKVLQKSTQRIVQRGKQEVKPQATKNKPTNGKPIDKTSSGNNSQSFDSHTLPFPKDHTALFAPIGYPCDPIWGTKPHKLSKPPYEMAKQPNWMDARPNENEYDNASLVKAFKMLHECIETKYISANAPAASAYFNMQRELEARYAALDNMVERYNLLMDYYESLNNDDGLDYNVLMNDAKDMLCKVLKNDTYKKTIRSSIAPLKEYLKEETVKYIEQHGGFDNAHIAKLTVIQEKKKSTVSTSSSFQNGTILREGTTGAHIEIDGITYIIHLQQGSAFASKVAEMAVRGKDVVMPDYIKYKGKQFPVEYTRAGLFSGKNINSIKLPATLKEIAVRTFMRSSISEIVIPASVKTISGTAFAECTNLKKVVFEGDEISVMGGCFPGCTALQSITLPKFVGKMGEGMFDRCSNLTSVTLPKNLKELPKNTFNNCTKLTNVTIPTSVTKLGGDVFNGSGVVSLDLSHVMEFDEFGSIGSCANLKNVKLNAKLKDVFVSKIYLQFQNCPHMVLKYENGKHVYPAGLVFVDTK